MYLLMPFYRLKTVGLNTVLFLVLINLFSSLPKSNVNCINCLALKTISPDSSSKERKTI